MGNQASVETQTFLGYLGGVDISLDETKAKLFVVIDPPIIVLAAFPSRPIRPVQLMMVFQGANVHSVKYTDTLYVKFMEAFDSNQDGEINWSEIMAMPRDFRAICILCHKLQVEGAMMLKKQAHRTCPLCPSRLSIPYTHHRHCEHCALARNSCMVCGEAVRKFQMRIQAAQQPQQQQYLQPQHLQQIHVQVAAPPAEAKF